MYYAPSVYIGIVLPRCFISVLRCRCFFLMKNFCTMTMRNGPSKGGPFGPGPRTFERPYLASASRYYYRSFLI